MGAILAESAACMIVNFDGGGEVETSRFETSGLSSSSRTNFQNC
jgi:hypothetical protein